MAGDRLDLFVTMTGDQRVRRGLSDIGRSAGGAGKEVSLLQRSLRLLGAGLIVKELINYNDELVTIKNRLKVVTDGQNELNTALAGVRDIANETFSSLRGTTELYVRLSLASKNLNLANFDLIQTTRSLQQAIKLSTSDVREAENAMIQLSQGIASNRLGGDELRSVLEQLPVVADVIAKEMGVTRGELREFGREGKITAQVVVDAFRNAAEELNTQFSKITPTIGQSLQVLRNEAILALGDFENQIGVFEALSNAILFLARNMEVITKIAEILAVVLIVKVGKALAVAAWIRLGQAVSWVTKIIEAQTLAWAAWETFAQQAMLGTAGLGVLARSFLTLASAAAIAGAAVGFAAAEIFNWGTSSERANTPLQETIFFATKLKPKLDKLNEAFRSQDPKLWAGILTQARQSMRLAADEAEELDKKVRSITDSLFPFQGSVRKLSENLEILERKYTLVNDQLKQLGKGGITKREEEEFRRLTEQSEDLQIALLKLKSSFFDLKSPAREARETIEKYKRTYDDVLDRSIKVDEATNELREAFEELGLDISGVDAIVQKWLETLDDKRTKRSADEFKRMKENFEALQNSVFSVTAANREFFEAIELVRFAHRRLNLTIEDGLIILGRVAAQYDDLDVVFGDQKAATEALQARVFLLSREYEAGIGSIEAYIETLKKWRKLAGDAAVDAETFGAALQGGARRPSGLDDPITQDFAGGVDDLVKAQKDNNKEQDETLALLGRLDPAWAAYDNRVRLLNEAFEAGILPFEVYRKELEKADKLLEDPTQLSPLQQRIQALTTEIADAESLVGVALVDAFDSALTAGVEMFNAWDFRAERFSDILNNLKNQLLRLAILQGLGAAGLGEGLNKAFDIPGKQFGGSIRVPGSGGPDSELALLRLTPGERVDFVPPSQQRREAAGAAGAGGGPVSVNAKTVVVADMRQAVLEVLASEPGQRVQVSNLERHRRRIRRML